LKTVIVKNQAEWDALPEKYEEYTAIHIYSDTKNTIVVKRTPGNATVRASGDATVWASENATVRVWGNATVEAWGNATVEAWENATVEAWENATVRASGNATVRAWGNAIIRALAAIKIEAFHWVTVICQDCKPAIKRHGENVTIARTKTLKHTQETFTDIYPADKQGFTEMFKSVRPDTLCDFYTGDIKYEGVVECPDWDANKDRQCGGGLHVSPTPEMALRYNGGGKVLRVRVHKDDYVVYPDDITKVRCRKLEVIGPVEEANT